MLFRKLRLGRNTIIGPGLVNVNFSVVKDNHISAFGEALNLQFRAEMFNILNRPNFAAVPTGNLESLDSTGSAVGIWQTRCPLADTE
jgi:hypothetical protein